MQGRRQTLARQTRAERGIARHGRTRSLGGVGLALGLASLGAGLVSLSGCATQGDFLRLQEKVAEYHRPRKDEPDPFKRIAELSAEVDALRQQMMELEGQLEVARKDASDALVEVRQARTALAQGLSAGEGTGAAQGAATAGGAAAGSALPGAAAAVTGGDRAGETGGGASAPDQELAAYQQALDAWRSEDFDACIDRFTAFLQSHPTSGYADDAAYWLADCTYKKDDFKRAVVRFNAVVSVYPESPKAPDALYRQGESLLKLGPKFHEAARTVFRRVQKDYPSSERAVEAAQQLERLGPGSSTQG